MLEAAWSSTFDPSTGTPGIALAHGVVNNQIYFVFIIMFETIYIWLTAVDVSRNVPIFPSLLKRNISQRQFQL